ncbi:MAG TPA: UDP-3-O-(3-hydroxymyristoyl)glucosamine N-acyltransferase [Bacteroidia bacterium]|nr:UDP-3-O-(3-hydroxymyristoyl)glucosamine N-acyltransferase [Bacteroidia bacterium]
MKLKIPSSLQEISSLIKAKAIGKDDFPITGLNEIHKVEKGDLTFVDHPKYYEKALQSAATTILINKEVECPVGKALIISDDPFRDYNILTSHFRKFRSSEKLISDEASIGENTIIQPGVFVGHHAAIGKNCLVHSGVVIYNHCVVGNNVIIHANTVIGSDAFYFKRRSEGYDKLISCGRVIVEDDVEIGACCTIDKGVSGDTVVGKGTKMDNHVHVGHDTVIGKNCLFAAQVGIAGVVTIEDDVILWGQVGVQKDLTIGKGAVVLGQSGIGKSLEGNKTYFGSPVRDARDKMKEIALMKRLPELIQKLD